MGTESVWEVLGQIPIGVLVAWLIVFGIIVGVIYAGVMKLFHLFVSLKKKKDEFEEIKEAIDRHDDQIEDIGKKIDNVIHILEKQNDDKRIEMRHSIVRAGEEALAEGKISIRKWKALHEMYDVYHQPDEHGVVGNGYVSTLMDKLDKLPIEGKLDENNNDI